MNKILKILFGLILLVGTVYFTYSGQYLESWGKAAIELIKGGVTLIVALIGLALIILGIADLKN